jgi:Vacuolar protein sorting 55
MEAGKFLAGFSAVGLVAVPAILAHAAYITPGAMMIELCAAASIGMMVVVYDYSQHSYY